MEASLLLLMASTLLPFEVLQLISFISLRIFYADLQIFYVTFRNST